MRARVLTAAVGIPVFLGAVVAGGVWWFLLVCFIIFVGLWEWQRLIRRSFDVTVPLDALFGGGLLVALPAYNAAKADGAPGLEWAAALMLVTVYAVAREALSSRRRPLLGGGAVVLGVVYVAGLLSHLVLLRGVSGHGLLLTLVAVVGTWLTDTGAFFVGRALGGRKLMPALSPNKTVSGAVGGWIAGFLGVLGTGAFAASLPLGRALLLAAAVPVAAQLGDLMESAFKREAGVKDSGRLLPGHGGVLDRFDSLMLVAPTVYYIATWL